MFGQTFDAVGFVILAAAAVALIWLPLNWRSPFTLKRRFAIGADRQTVWQAVRLAPGDVAWNPHLKKITAMTEDASVVRLWHELSAPDGRSPAWSYDMAVELDEPNYAFTAERLGPDGERKDDKLLQLSARLAERAGTTILEWREDWGPRSLAGRFMAYSDADRALAQLKSYCETGKVCGRTARSAGSALSLFSACTTSAWQMMCSVPSWVPASASYC